MRGVWSKGSRRRERPKRTWREVVREDCQARKLNTEDAMDHSKWRKLIKDVRWSGWVWVGECFFWYWLTQVVPDQRPLNCCVCVCTLFVRCLCSGFSASDKSAVWVLRCKQVTIMTEPCPAVKYAGQMDSSSLTNYFRVLNLPAIVSILRLH